jgi:hypothetical protein
MSIPPFRVRAVARLVLSLASLPLLGACLSGEEFETSNRYGSVTIESAGAEGGRVVATPVASFFRGGEIDLPTSRVTGDNCGTFNFATETFAPGNLDAGAALQLQVGAASYQMRQSPQVPRLYVLASGSSFTYAPGDTARLSVPGVTGGFPGSQVTVRLAEPIQLGTVTAGEINQDLPVSWTANGDANSSVILSVRYTSSTTNAQPDVQVLCIVRDNGAYSIPSSLLGNYYASNPASRALNVLRWRTNATRVDDRTSLYIVSTADTTVALIP